MRPLLIDLARAIATSPVNAWSTYMLREVPGFPPIIQTVHILSIAAVMGSVVLIDLRALGFALRSQSVRELTRRLMPWLWCALPLLALSGLVFVFARPQRYLVNPVLGLKFAMLLPAVILAFIFQRMTAKTPELWEQASGRRTLARAIAGVSLVLWMGVAFAGRWIAYADYIFPPQ